MKLKTLRALTEQAYKEALAEAEAEAKAEAAKDAAEFLLRNYNGVIPGTSIQIIKIGKELSINGTYWSEKQTLFYIDSFMSRLENDFGSFKVEPEKVSKEEIRKEIINSNKRVYAEKTPARHTRNKKNLRVLPCEKEEFSISKEVKKISRDCETHCFTRQDRLKCERKHFKKEKREFENSLLLIEEREIKNSLIYFEGGYHNVDKMLLNLQNGGYKKYASIFKDEGFEDFVNNFEIIFHNRFQGYARRINMEKKWVCPLGESNKTLYYFDKDFKDEEGRILLFDRKEDLLEAAVVFYIFRVYSYGY